MGPVKFDCNVLLITISDYWKSLTSSYWVKAFFPQTAPEMFVFGFVVKMNPFPFSVPINSTEIKVKVNLTGLSK
jgi:hypothetical protein